jgi:pimeloyl-ACP methyl ester carboxylesterase
MILVCGVAALLILALVTQIGVFLLERAYPAQGRMVEVAGAGLPVAGARLHVVELGPRDAPGPAIVMVHGASSNLGAMRFPLGDRLAGNHRVILIDRPGHGWSTVEDAAHATPAVQAAMIDEALGKLGVDHAILLVHSLAGVLGAKMALDYPQRVAGLVMLAPVTHRWPGGVGTYNKVVTTPVIGPLLAYTVTMPVGLLLAKPAARTVFLPQVMPDDWVGQSATLLLLRPREFLANAWDLVTLKDAVIEQSPRYGDIKVPVVAIHGEADKTVSVNIHARPFTATVPGAKLIVIPDLGHMVQNARTDLVIGEIETMIAKLQATPKAAMR